MTHKGQSVGIIRLDDIVGIIILNWLTVLPNKLVK
ncbi:hypothetical protein HmCmsJML117_01049 [Escherichia coli]|nr:hypothetical protein HmCmsJML117_01049 [Escherichia coli]